MKQSVHADHIENCKGPHVKRRGRAGVLKGQRVLVSPKSAFMSHTGDQNGDRSLITALERQNTRLQQNHKYIEKLESENAAESRLTDIYSKNTVLSEQKGVFFSKGRWPEKPVLAVQEQ